MSKYFMDSDKIKKIFRHLYSKRKEVLLFLTIICLRLFFFKTTYKPSWFPDSWGYATKENYHITFWGILPSFWTQYRTFVYPVCIRFLQFFFGEEKYLLAVIGFQEIISFVSVFFFYAALKEITQNKVMVFFATMFYACSPAILGWNYCILTESLALSFCAVYLFLLCKFIKTKSDSYGAAAFVWVLLMTFERPSFLMFLPITIVFVAIFSVVGKYRKFLKTFCTASLSLVIVLLYAFGFYKNYGIFSISDRVPVNILISTIEREYYKKSPDPEFKKFVEKSWNGEKSEIWPAMWKVLDRYGLSEIRKQSKACIMNSKTDYLKDEVKLSIDTASGVWNGYHKNKADLKPIVARLKKLYESFFLIFHPSHSLFIAFLSLIVFAIQLAKRRINWLLAGCFGYVFLIFMTTMVLTCAEFMRTMIHILPIFFFNIVALTDSVQKDSEKWYLQKF